MLILKLSLKNKCSVYENLKVCFCFDQYSQLKESCFIKVALFENELNLLRIKIFLWHRLSKPEKDSPRVYIRSNNVLSRPVNLTLTSHLDARKAQVFNHDLNIFLDFLSRRRGRIFCVQILRSHVLWLKLPHKLRPFMKKIRSPERKLTSLIATEGWLLRFELDLWSIAINSFFLQKQNVKFHQQNDLSSLQRTNPFNLGQTLRHHLATFSTPKIGILIILESKKIDEEYQIPRKRQEMW